MNFSHTNLMWGCVALGLSLAFQANAATNVVARKVQYGFTLQNTRGEVLPLSELWVCGPAARTSSQACRQIGSTHPYLLTTDAFGNQLLHFSFTNLPPYGVKIINIEADLDLTESPTEAVLPSGTAITDWLKPERFVEIENTGFLRLAPSLEGTNAITKAEAIFRWVRGNVESTAYSAKDQGALYALRERKGDCTEHMYLFLALCRHSQVPARGLGGYVCPRNMILRPTDYHNWAEFYDGNRWQLADPYRNVFMPKSAEYVATRILGGTNGPLGNFLRFHYRGDGLKVEMN
jgi:hypothetical protein